MSAGLALLGWALAFAALGAGALVQRELSRRMELVARAAHELRGPLTAARLGLHLVDRARGTPGDRLAAVDLALPDTDGLELIARVRAADGVATRVNPDTPLLVLTGRDGELDRLRGFERGCDDYMVKPFSYPELRLRIAALLRRADRGMRRGRLRVGELEIDPPSRRVTLAGQLVELSQKEFALLRTLASEPTRVFTKEELLRTVWGFRSMGSTRTLDSHACRLRRKLGANGDRYVVNVWGAWG